MTNHIITDGNARFEKKVLLPQSKSHLVKCHLIYNGFKKQHNLNFVTSIYFDDIHLGNLRDNIDGNPQRTKLRARYYNNDFSNIRLELKYKDTYVGSKKIVKVRKDFCSNAEIIDFCTKWSKVNIVKYVHPTAIISYTREYFVKGSIRATVDYNVDGKRFAGKNQIRGAQHSYGVLEFKYERNKEQEMRRLYTSLNLPVNRITKSSKYANTLIRW